MLLLQDHKIVSAVLLYRETVKYCFMEGIASLQDMYTVVKDLIHIAILVCISFLGLPLP